MNRALIRAKVELAEASQQPRQSAARGRHSAAARELLALAERSAWCARLPLAIVICGMPATGKSQLAQALAAASGLSHLSSDVTRKRLAGIDPTKRGDAEIYSSRFSELTYAELGTRAQAQVRAHGGVLVDGTFRRHVDRAAFMRAFAHAAPLLFVECSAPASVLVSRVRARELQPQATSDATLEVVLAQTGTWEDLQEVDAEAHLALRSDRPVQRLLGDLLAMLDRRLGLRPPHPADRVRDAGKP